MDTQFFMIIPKHVYENKNLNESQKLLFWYISSNLEDDWTFKKNNQFLEYITWKKTRIITENLKALERAWAIEMIFWTNEIWVERVIIPYIGIAKNCYTDWQNIARLVSQNNAIPSDQTQDWNKSSKKMLDWVYILYNNIINKNIEYISKKISEIKSRMEDNFLILKTEDWKKSWQEKIDMMLSDLNIHNNSEITSQKAAEYVQNFIYWHWNSYYLNIKSIKSLDDDIKKRILFLLKNKKIEFEDIIKAIDVYAGVMEDPSSWFTYRWTLGEFLTRKWWLLTFKDKEISDYSTTKKDNKLEIFIKDLEKSEAQAIKNRYNRLKSEGKIMSLEQMNKYLENLRKNNDNILDTKDIKKVWSSDEARKIFEESKKKMTEKMTELKEN